MGTSFPIIGSTFNIRPLELHDMEAALEVYRQCEDFLALGPNPHASLAMVEADLQLSRESGGIFCGIYDMSGSMVGVVDFIPENFEGNPLIAFIELLMIAARSRRKGLGSKIVSLIEAKVAEVNVEGIQAGVQVNNPAALSFWKSLGYQIISGPTLQEDGTTVFQLNKLLVK